jgi:tetratricopeptide repeat protein 21B
LIDIAIEKNEKWNKSPTHYEVSSLYILLIGAQTNSKQRDEASMTMDYAFRLFSGTMYESYFVLEQAKNAIVNGNIQLALDILTAIKPKQSYTLLIRNYLEARSIMADIYLNHRHDRKKYASCFREVVDQNPTVESCLLLGDAYMKIQEVTFLNLAGASYCSLSSST